MADEIVIPPVTNQPSFARRRQKQSGGSRKKSPGKASDRGENRKPNPDNKGNSVDEFA